MNINDLIRVPRRKNAVAHGWWEEERSFAELIALMHSELWRRWRSTGTDSGCKRCIGLFPSTNPKEFPLSLQM